MPLLVVLLVTSFLYKIKDPSREAGAVMAAPGGPFTAGPQIAGQLSFGGSPFSIKDKMESKRCEVELLNGVIQDLWETVKGLAGLGKMAWEASTNKVKSWWSSWGATEDKLSEAAHLVASEDDSFLTKLKQDPKAVIAELATMMWHMGNNWVMNNFGCEAWDGIPHASQCIKPMESWRCASCKQMTQAFCAIGGVLAGEVLVSYLMGAGFAKGITLSVSATQKMSATLASKAPELHKAIKTGMQVGAQVVKGGARFSKSAWGSFKSSPAARAVLSDPRVLGARMAAQDFKQVYSRVSNTRTAQAAVLGAKVVSFPLRTYMQLLDDAGRCGFEVGTKPWLFKNRVPQTATE